MPKAPRLQKVRPGRRLLVGAGIGLLLAGVLALLRGTSAFEGIEMRLLDVRTKAYVGSRGPDPRIVLAVVQEHDLEAIKQAGGYDWPWPLDVTAPAFEWMKEAGAAAVVVDVFQFDRGRIAEEMDATSANAQTIAKVHEESKSVAPLAKAYVGLHVTLAIETLNGSDPMGPNARALRLPVFERLLAQVSPIDVTTEYVRKHVHLPVVRLLEKAVCVGFANQDVDDDGILRRAIPIGRWGRRPVPSLALSGAIAAGIAVDGAGDRIRVGDAETRIARDGTFLVAFRGQEDTYPKVRPSDMVLAGSELEGWIAGGRKGPLPSVGSAKPEAVRGKIVVWGVNPPGVKDVVSVPISERFPGPEFQATVLDNLLHGDGRVPVGRGIDVAVLALVAALCGVLSSLRLPRGVGFVAVLAVAAAFVLAAYRLFAGGTSIDLFTPVVGAFAAWGGVTGYRLLTEGKRNKWLEGTFSQYLSPAVIESLKADPTKLKLGGQEREISVLFSDVKGFTSISERLEPDQLVSLLNDYLTRQSEPVLAEDGVIDKFIGDALMAFFGDPVPIPDHALRACRAAVRSIAAVEESLPLAKSLGIDVLSNRIGIASGPATMGNMGSAKRFSYTAMGDTVNLASRLEAANKAFGSRILLGPKTYAQAKAHIVAKPIARLQVVGKTEPVEVFELVGLVKEASEDLVRHAEAFARAHAAVRADDLEAAEAALTEAERLRPMDGPCAWLRVLVAELRAGRHPRPWSGVLILDSK